MMTPVTKFEAERKIEDEGPSADGCHDKGIE